MNREKPPALIYAAMLIVYLAGLFFENPWRAVFTWSALAVTLSVGLFYGRWEKNYWLEPKECGCQRCLLSLRRPFFQPSTLTKEDLFCVIRDRVTIDDEKPERPPGFVVVSLKHEGTRELRAARNLFGETFFDLVIQIEKPDHHWWSGEILFTCDETAGEKMAALAGKTNIEIERSPTMQSSLTADLALSLAASVPLDKAVQMATAATGQP